MNDNNFNEIVNENDIDWANDENYEIIEDNSNYNKLSDSDDWSKDWEDFDESDAEWNTFGSTTNDNDSNDDIYYLDGYGYIYELLLRHSKNKEQFNYILGMSREEGHDDNLLNYLISINYSVEDYTSIKSGYQIFKYENLVEYLLSKADNNQVRDILSKIGYVNEEIANIISKSDDRINLINSNYHLRDKIVTRKIIQYFKENPDKTDLNVIKFCDLDTDIIRDFISMGYKISEDSPYNLLENNEIMREEFLKKVIIEDKEIFNKINGIGKGEAHIFAQAVDEMRGKQYANIQQRINTTENILDKEFKNLRTEKNMSKDSNKIKTFGAKGEYKTDTAGIVDYKYNAYGVAYVHESEDIKLGKGIGWYTGIVHNKFKFKDIGKSKEEQLQTKLGIFKSRPYDDNNSLNWTTSAEIFVGYNRMDRKFLVVDEIYQAKSKYYTYGIGVRNEVSKEYRLSEDFRLKPYAALKLEYGRVSKIKEKNGEIKLEVKSNDYISIKPEIGTELAYRHYFGVKTLNTSIGIAYENELGKVANGKNKAKVSDTNADWFNIRGEKEDRKGNVKFDLNVGLDNQRFGVTGNIGYDTKGSNLRGGLGLRVIF